MKIIRTKTVITTMCLLWLTGIISSCGTYYQLSSVHYGMEKRLFNELNVENTIVFVHVSNEMFQLKDVTLNNKNILQGTITPTNPAEEAFYNRINETYSKKMHFKKDLVIQSREKAKQQGIQVDTLIFHENTQNGESSFDNGVIHQIHLHTNSLSNIENNVSINLKDLIHVAFFKKNSDFGAGAKVLVTTILSLGLLSIIITAIACNCPHVYVQNGASFVYTNTLFTGALNKQLERFDYKNLQDFHPEKNSLFMQIKNEDEEKQFTNLLGLKVAYHDPSFQVINDKSGNLYSIVSPQNAIRIVDQENIDQTQLLSSDNESYFTFDSPTRSGLVSTDITFNKPTDISNAKLILNLKNSDWAGYIHQKFLENIGSYQKEWLESNSNKTAEQQQQALKKGGIPLVVYVKKKNKWIEVETIQPVGNVSDQSIVIPIDEKLLTEPTIEIRLQSGFKFWDLDYVAMDFTKQKEFEIQTIQPSFVSGNESNLQALSTNDKSYIATESGSEAISVRFDGIRTNKNRTLFLESKGYYIRSKMETTDPKWMELAKMSRKNGLGRFSQETFLKTMMSIQQLNLTSAANK
jgi:adenylate kinase family enzyme